MNLLRADRKLAGGRTTTIGTEENAKDRRELAEEHARTTQNRANFICPKNGTFAHLIYQFGLFRLTLTVLKLTLW